MKKRIILLILLLLITSCSAAPSTIIQSTSPLPPGVRGTISGYGSDCQYYFLGLLPITGSASTEEALEEAKEDARSEVLTDVVIDTSGGYYILYSNNCIRVSGKGVRNESEF
jgi:hypothetical protein